METVDYKVGHTVYPINNNDRVMFNGSVYILVTREVRSGWNKYSPTVAKAKAKRLVKLGILVETEPYVSTAMGSRHEYLQYRFDLDEPHRFLSEGGNK